MKKSTFSFLLLCIGFFLVFTFIYSITSPGYLYALGENTDNGNSDLAGIPPPEGLGADDVGSSGDPGSMDAGGELATTDDPMAKGPGGTDGLAADIVPVSTESSGLACIPAENVGGVATQPKLQNDGYSETRTRMEQGDPLAATYVKELQSGKEYMFAIDPRNGEYVVSDPNVIDPATGRNKILTPGEVALHGDIEVRNAFGAAGQQRYDNWSKPYVTTVQDLSNVTNLSLKEAPADPGALGANLFDEKLGDPTGRHNVDVTRYQGSVTTQLGERSDKYYQGAAEAGGETQALQKRVQENQDVAALYVRDRTSGQEYMIFKQDQPNGRSLYQIADAKTRQILPQGTAQLHNDNLEVRAGFGSLDKLEWTDAYVTKRADLNIFANYGRTDTSNAIGLDNRAIAAPPKVDPYTPTPHDYPTSTAGSDNENGGRNIYAWPKDQSDKIPSMDRPLPYTPETIPNPYVEQNDAKNRERAKNGQKEEPLVITGLPTYGTRLP